MSKDYSPFCRVSAPQTSCQRPLAPPATCQPILQLLIHSCGATLCARRTRLPLPAHTWWGSSSGGFAVSLSLLCWAIMAHCFLCILVRLKKKKKKDIQSASGQHKYLLQLAGNRNCTETESRCTRMESCGSGMNYVWEKGNIQW